MVLELREEREEEGKNGRENKRMERTRDDEKQTLGNEERDFAVSAQRWCELSLMRERRKELRTEPATMLACWGGGEQKGLD